LPRIAHFRVIPFTTLAIVENSRAFVRTSLLYFRIPNAFSAALVALSVGVHSLRLDLMPLDRLGNIELLSEPGGEV